MQKFLVLFAVVVSCAARAEDVYVVMHTTGEASTGLDNAIHAVLAERDMKVVVAPTANELASGLQAAACKSGPDVCALAVGRALGATRVIASSVTATDAGWAAELSFHDITTGVIVRRQVSGPRVDTVRSVRIETLKYAGLPLKGRLLVNGLPEGALLLIDGADALVVPMTKPVMLTVGEHELQARFNDGPIYKQQVVVEGEQQVELALCATGSDIAPCTETAPRGTVGPSPLFVAGVVGVGIGAAAIVVGVAANVLANERTFGTSAEEERQQFRTMSTIATAAYISGGVLTAAGLAATIIGGVSE
jgi:hypothetical protein